MTHGKRKLRVAKPRIYIAAAILAISIAAFLLIRNALVESRGYTAIGGEYLIIPAGMLLAYQVCRVSYKAKKAEKADSNEKVRLVVIDGGKSEIEERATNV